MKTKDLTPDNISIRSKRSKVYVDPDTEHFGDVLAGWAIGSDEMSKGSVKIQSTKGKILNISIGGDDIQYQVGNEGMLTYGDGSDGALSTTGNVTLTEDKYYTDLTINDGHTFNPAGYRVFVTGTLTVKNGGILLRNGNNGGNGGNGVNGSCASDTGALGSRGLAGTALADGYLKGSVAGAAGGGLGAGVEAGNSGITNSIGKDGVVGVAGGKGGDGCGAGGGAESGGAKGTVAASNVKLIANWHLMTLLDVSSTGSLVKFDNSAGTGGSGHGGKGYNGVAQSGKTRGYGGGGGGGGGSGSGGGIVAIYARNIVIESTGLISANGGNGGNGGDGGDYAGWYDGCGYPSSDFGLTGAGGGGGGGCGGDGGQLILVYNTLTNDGSITASAGTGGTKGAGGVTSGGVIGDDGDDGVVGTSGTVGTIYQFQLSL